MLRFMRAPEFLTCCLQRRAGGGRRPGCEGDRAQEVSRTVAGIIAAVAAEGDAALARLTRELDGVDLGDAGAAVPSELLAVAELKVRSEAPQLVAALEVARSNIEAHHRRLLPQPFFQEHDGLLTGEVVRPLDRVGIYVPGGRAAYPSSVLMAAVPAHLAGVPEVYVCTPPGRDGRVDPAILYACAQLGVTRVFRAGGAQAVAAMALGTATVPAVDKVVGPGNAYVTEAKRQLCGVVGIDLLAGPSEVAVCADADCPPEWVVADLLAQAEHDPDALVVCASDSPELLAACDQLWRREVSRLEFDPGCILVSCRDLEEAVRVCNAFAPEHLELLCERPFDLLPLVRAAGAVFLGRHTCVPLGDYAAGPNHILPTAGAARFRGGLGPGDFCRRIGFVYRPEGATSAAPGAARHLAVAEGLPCHAAAIALREQDAGGPGGECP